MKKILLLIFVLLLPHGPAAALTQHEISMFKKLQSKWERKSTVLMRQRSKLKGRDPAYTRLTKKIIKANYWSNYYTEAQIDKSTIWTIIKNTFVWTAQDLAEIGSIMWDSSEGLIQNLYEGKWTDILKSTTDSLMRQKIRKLIRNKFDGKAYKQIEDHIMDKFILPKLDKSKLHEYAETAFGKAKDKLQDAYVEEVKRQAASRSKAELQKYGEQIAARVGGAVSAAEFTLDMVQKYVMWNDAQKTITSMLSHIEKVKKRERCSYVKAFNIYLGKEKMTATAKKTKALKPDKPGKNPLSFHPHFVDPASVDKTAPTLKRALGEVTGSGKRKSFKSPNQCYDAFVKKSGLPTGNAISYRDCTKSIDNISCSTSNGFKSTGFHKNGRASREYFKTPHPNPKFHGILRAWTENGAITHWIKYKHGKKMCEVKFSFGGKPYVVYFYENEKKTGSIRYSYQDDGKKLIEIAYMYKGKVLKLISY